MNPLRKKLFKHLQVIMRHSAKLEASIAIMHKREPQWLPISFGLLLRRIRRREEAESQQYSTQTASAS